jgi:hypothetical protein
MMVTATANSADARGLRQLPGGLRSRKAAADDVDVELGRHCERSEAIQNGGGSWIASSLRSSR